MTHYRCVVCHEGEPRLQGEVSPEGRGRFVCAKCGATYDLCGGVLKLLVPEPPKHYFDALSYARKCLGQADLEWRTFTVQRVEYNPEFRNLLEHHLNFDSIMCSLREEIQPRSHVLQIGCRDTTHYLQWFLENGHEAWGCDQYIHVEDDWADLLGDPTDETLGPRFAVTDLENLPYQDNAFDIVVMSHTLLHARHPEIACKEVWRILKPEGMFILLNEPQRGLLSPLAKYQKAARLPHPREKRYFFWDYYTALREAGFLRLQLFFPEYQHQLLKLWRVSPFTFKILSILLRPFWWQEEMRRSIRRNGIIPAYFIIGFPLQVMSRKRSPDDNEKPGFILPVDAPLELASRLPQRGDIGERRKDNTRGTDRRKGNAGTPRKTP